MTWLVNRAAAVILAAAVSAGAQQTADDGERFVAELRQALAAGNRAAVASMVEFPATVWAGSIRLPVADAAALLAQYDAIFTADMVAVVDQGRIERRSADAISVAGGAIEAERIGGRFRITRIAVLTASRDLQSPPAAGSSSSPAGPGASAGTRAVRTPRRLTFRAGQRSAQWADTVAAHETDAYVLFVAQGQMLDVRLDRVRGRDVIVAIVDHKTGRPVDARAGAGLRTWTGRIPAAGDYRIDVTRTVAESEPPLPYVLTVSFK
jgi:hypothetical protein